jgi:hypothetical protein
MHQSCREMSTEERHKFRCREGPIGMKKGRSRSESDRARFRPEWLTHRFVRCEAGGPPLRFSVTPSPGKEGLLGGATHQSRNAAPVQ